MLRNIFAIFLFQRRNEWSAGCAVLIDADGQLSAAGHNQAISTFDPGAHVEIVTLGAAASGLVEYESLQE